MKWIRSQEQPIPHFKSSVLTVGNFDGVHLGHQKLLQQLVKAARENNTQSVACTFRPHPRTILKPEEPHHRLFDYRDQVEVMTELGVDALIEEKFSKDFSLMSADEFLSSYVEKIFNPVHLVVGYDFSFGKSRGGNNNFLQDYCDRKKIGLSIVSPYDHHGTIVSSSQIRKYLEHGDVQKAAEFLGRPYYLRGPVRVGYKRGRSIGVPTANISPEIDFVPRRGVYLTWAYLGGQRYASITNIGFNPTFEHSDSYLKVETHIFDFDRDIYGEHMRVELISFQRDEIRFNGIEPLKQQIANDMAKARDYFSGLR